MGNSCCADRRDELATSTKTEPSKPLKLREADLKDAYFFINAESPEEAVRSLAFASLKREKVRAVARSRSCSDTR